MRRSSGTASRDRRVADAPELALDFLERLGLELAPARAADREHARRRHAVPRGDREQRRGPEVDRDRARGGPAGAPPPPPPPPAPPPRPPPPRPPPSSARRSRCSGSSAGARPPPAPS